MPVNRIQLPLDWFVMLSKPHELLLRKEKLEPDPPTLAIITDASPHGIGAVLAFVVMGAGKLTPWATVDSKVLEEDARWLGVASSTSTSSSWST